MKLSKEEAAVYAKFQRDNNRPETAILIEAGIIQLLEDAQQRFIAEDLLPRDMSEALVESCARFIHSTIPPEMGPKTRALLYAYYCEILLVSFMQFDRPTEPRQ